MVGVLLPFFTKELCGGEFDEMVGRKETEIYCWTYDQAKKIIFKIDFQKHRSFCVWVSMSVIKSLIRFLF